MFTQSALVTETGKLQKFALRLTRNRADADDLVQSTCLRALEKADYFEEGSNLFGWTSKIMFNIFVSGYRRRKKFETQFDPAVHLEKMSVAPTQDISIQLSDVKKAMKKLSPDHREILILTCVKGMHYEEVSAELHIPVGTVRSRLYRAREQLQIIMEAPPENPSLMLAISKEPANLNLQSTLKRAVEK